MKDINAKTVLDEETSQFYYEGLANYTKYKGSNVAHYLDELSRPNLLINGGFQVWQRGQEFSIAGYTADRWKFSIATGNKPLLKATNYGLNITEITDSLEGNQLDYFFETMDTKSLSKKTITLSISRKGSVKMRLRLKNGNNYVLLAESLENKLTVELPEYQNGDLLNVSLITYKTVDINWVRLEIGSFATPFYPRSYAEELLLCQRYYQRTEQFTSLCISNAQLSKSYTGTTFLVKMRTLPEITNINIITSNNVDISNLYHTARWSVNGISYIDLKERKGDCIHVNYVWLDAEIY